MMDRTPQVTVVIPTHNRGGLLPTTLRTVLWQREVDLEVVVVDDASTDDTAAVVAKIGDPRVRLLRQEVAGGVSVARNRGAAEGVAEWLAFIDDDDLWAPDKLALQLDAVRETRRDWAYAGQVNVTLDLEVIGGAPPLPPEQLVQRLPQANAVPGGGSGVIVRAQMFHEEGGFDTGFRHFADWDLWIRLSRRGLPGWVPHPLIGYRVHAGARSMDTRGMVEELNLIEQRHGVEVDRVAFYRHVAQVSLRGGRHLDAVVYYLRAAAMGRRRHPNGRMWDIRRAGVTASRAVLARARPWVPGVVRSLRPRRSHPEPHAEWQEEGRTWVNQVGPD